MPRRRGEVGQSVEALAALVPDHLLIIRNYARDGHVGIKRWYSELDSLIAEHGGDPERDRIPVMAALGIRPQNLIRSMLSVAVPGHD